jgi:hypothetical protein
LKISNVISPFLLVKASLCLNPFGYIHNFLWHTLFLLQSSVTLSAMFFQNELGFALILTSLFLLVYNKDHIW